MNDDTDFETENNTAKESKAMKKTSKKDDKTEKTSMNSKKKKKSKRLSWLFLLVFTVVFFNAFNIIQEGFVGVSKRLGKAQAILSPGFHAKIPFVDSVELLETRVRIIELESQATNADHIEVKLKLIANWHLPPASVEAFYQKHSNPQQYEQRVLIPLLHSVSHGFISQYTTAQLIEKRSLIGNLISMSMATTLASSATKLDLVTIEKFNLPESYQKGIEEKLAQQQILETEQLKISKEKIKAQANYDIAKIKANALIQNSEATAEAMLIEGEAKAKVIKGIIRAMQDNRYYVQYEKIQKWDGKLSNSLANPNEIFKSIEK